MRNLWQIFLVLTANLQGQTATQIKFEYDNGSPWARLKTEGDRSYEMHQLMLPAQFPKVSSFESDFFDPLTPFSAVVKLENVKSLDLPTAMFIVKDGKNIPIHEIAEANRNKFYEYDISTMGIHTPSAFKTHFPWCAFANLADACKNAADSIVNRKNFIPDLNTLSGSLVGTIDGSKKLAEKAKNLLENRFNFLNNQKKHGPQSMPTQSTKNFRSEL